VVRTLGGDLPADELGLTYTHEHLIIDSDFVARELPHIHLDSAEDAEAEVNRCIRAGVRTMVDAMPAASGRDPEKLARISILTGMRIVASTGLHTAKYYDDVEWTREESPDQLADRFVADIDVGIDKNDYLTGEIDRTETRAGVVKVGTMTDELSPRDRRLFEAAAITQQRTGVPILTHTEGGSGGMPQIAALLELGVSPASVTLSHTDKIADPGYHDDLMSTGVRLCYDQALRFENDQTNQTAILVREMVDRGFVDQIVLGTDGARRSLWGSLGGSPGLAWLATGFRGILESIGLSRETTKRIFETNPRRMLTLTPKV
jgi:phosphotriesterase-related protein